jgi:dihydroxyacetone kinase
MHLLTDTTKMEEAVVSRRVLQNLHERGITVTSYYCGHYMTSLDMAGLSVTIMR